MNLGLLFSDGAVIMDRARAIVRRWGRPVGALFGLVLAACEDAPVTQAVILHDDVRTFLQGAMAQGPVPVEVRGRPYDAAPSGIAQATLGAMTAAMTWTATPRLSTDGADRVGRSFRIITVFNDERSAQPCRTADGGGEPQLGGRVTVTLTFCSGEDALARVDGRVGQTEGLADRRFQALIRQATRDLFPERRPS
jgi:hypothetical protein